MFPHSQSPEKAGTGKRSPFSTHVYESEYGHLVFVDRR